MQFAAMVDATSSFPEEARLSRRDIRDTRDSCDVVTDRIPRLDSHLQLCGAMSEYDFRPGGSLKLKGGVSDGGIVKK